MQRIRDSSIEFYQSLDDLSKKVVLNSRRNGSALVGYPRDEPGHSSSDLLETWDVVKIEHQSEEAKI